VKVWKMKMKITKMKKRVMMTMMLMRRMRKKKPPLLTRLQVGNKAIRMSVNNSRITLIAT